MVRFSTYEQLQNHLVKAALGQVPVPISKENLSKAYAHFRGARAKETVLRITSRLDILLSLVPQTKEILPRLLEEDVAKLNIFINENALHEFKFAFNSSHEVRHYLLELRDEQYRTIAKVFRNPDQVSQALHSTSKKEWMSKLSQTPTTQNLLAASASLSSDEFFANQMHLAFMEIEPQVYGLFNEENEALCFEIMRLYRKEAHLKKLAQKLQAEEYANPKPLKTEADERVETKDKETENSKHSEQKFAQPEHEPSQTTEARKPKFVYKPEHKKAQNEASTEKAEQNKQKPVELPPLPKEEKKPFALSTHTKKHQISNNLNDIEQVDLEKVLSKELGLKINISTEQAEEILTSAKSVLFSKKETENRNSGFSLHKNMPTPEKKTWTIETINLSKK